MDINESLTNYNVYLNNLLQNPETLARFKLLSNCESLGCFCEPNSKCHVDIIRYYLHSLGLKVPNRQCVKVKYLRKINCTNLEEWVNNPNNCLCTRRGRIFITSGNDKRIYHYPQSEWHNPYKVE